MPAFRASIAAAGVREVCVQARARKARLVALWGSDRERRRRGLRAAPRPAFLRLAVAARAARARGSSVSGIADIYPAANRMQRAYADLVAYGPKRSGRAQVAAHGAWPEDAYPLRKDFDTSLRHGQNRTVTRSSRSRARACTRSGRAGARRHDRAGHFRFSIVGEKILRLEERLGYKHKGIEKRFEAMTLEEGAKLAGGSRATPPSLTAWAYAMAVEGATGIEPPQRALAIRGILLELERIANHLAIWATSARRRAVVRLCAVLAPEGRAAASQRAPLRPPLPDGRDRPGGGSARSPRAEAEDLSGHWRECGVKSRRAVDLRGARRRAGPLHHDRASPARARRAPGPERVRRPGERRQRDLRVDYPAPPYQQLDPRMISHTRGDVAARVLVRFEELFESMRLIGALVQELPPGEIRLPLAKAGSGASRCRLGRGLARGSADRARSGREPHSPPAPHDVCRATRVLEHAVARNIVGCRR